MITLTFNTTTKEVKITESNVIIKMFSNVPTVKPAEGYYEVLQEEQDLVHGKQRFPVARLPIANTIMFIEK